MESQTSNLDPTLQDLLAVSTQHYRESIALESASRSFSYVELEQVANQWGRLLRQLEVRRNTLVAVVMEKGVEQVLAVLGILQSGAAYLPIDPELPTERLHFLLINSDVSIVLTQSWLDKRLTWPDGIRRFSVDTDELVGVSEEPLEPVNEPDDLAFVIYTSGSTGEPKGVMIAQRGVVNCLVETNQCFAIAPGDKVLALTALHHDMSVYDIFGTLAAGGTIVMPEASKRKDPAHWIDLMNRFRVSIWNSVPAMMEMLLEYAEGGDVGLPDSLRLAFLGGDWIPVTLPPRLKKQVGNAKVISVGGPTETTLWNIWYPVEDVDQRWNSIPYGKPIANTKYYILDDALEECAAGVAGEMCCAGVGLAKGYWKDAERPNAKFVRHPQTGERLYRTGDQGRILPDGNIEFVGRIDNQVKINGQRIELGEIEASLLRNEHLREVAVVAVGDDRVAKRLVAYIVPSSFDMAADVDLRAYLSKKLPEHMIPSLFVLLDKLPLTANGKVDRRKLAEISPRRPGFTADEMRPKTKIEQDIAEIWREILHLDTVGVADNLFDLGAHSIHIVQAHARIAKVVGSEVQIVTLFQYPTIRSLADHLAATNTQSGSNGKIQAQAQRQRAARTMQQLHRRKTPNV